MSSQPVGFSQARPVDGTRLLEGFLAALVIATVTAPVGVSGAVFLSPVQLDLLHVPNPAVTPTDLMFNVVAGPGASLRYRRAGQLVSTTTCQLLLGTLPGVVIGAVVRVYLVVPKAFHLVAATVLLPIGVWLVQRSLSTTPSIHPPLPPRRITAMALVVGVVGGIYGIGGGSILGPHPARFRDERLEYRRTSCPETDVRHLDRRRSDIPCWRSSSRARSLRNGQRAWLGLGGLIGGYLGVLIQPRLPEKALRLLLGSLAIGLAIVYAFEALS